LKKLQELKSTQEPSAEQVHTKVADMKEDSWFLTLSCVHLWLMTSVIFVSF
jgi:hypothetical protein